MHRYNEDGVVELGSEELSVTDPWGQEFRVAQSGTAGDFPWSMGIAEVQLPVHPGTPPSSPFTACKFIDPEFCAGLLSRVALDGDDACMEMNY